MKMIMKNHPDLVLMDVIMPKLDGISVMERDEKRNGPENRCRLLLW